MSFTYEGLTKTSSHKLIRLNLTTCLYRPVRIISLHTEPGYVHFVQNKPFATIRHKIEENSIVFCLSPMRQRPTFSNYLEKNVKLTLRNEERRISNIMLYFPCALNI